LLRRLGPAGQQLVDIDDLEAFFSWSSRSGLLQYFLPYKRGIVSLNEAAVHPYRAPKMV
jgi:hypothetical protein